MKWDKEFRTRLYYYGLVFFAATMPFQRWVPPTYGLVVLWAAWLLQYPWNVPRNALARATAYLLMGFFALVVAGTFVSDHPNSAWDEVGRLMPLFFAPLSVIWGPPLRKERIQKVFDTFAWAVVLSLVLSLFIGLANYWQFRNTGDVVSPLHYLFYAKLSYFLEHQAAYTALYTLFALVILSNSSAYGTMRKLAVLFLFGVLFLLAARTQIALLVVLFPLWLFFKAALQQPRQKVAVLLVFIAAFVLALLAPKVTRNRMSELIDDMSRTAVAQDHQKINNRLYLWTGALELWSQRPLLGWGTHEAERLLTHRAKQQLSAAADTLPLSAVIHSDLALKNEFVDQFYPLSAGSNLRINSAHTFEFKVLSNDDSYTQWSGDTVHFYNAAGGFVGLRKKGILPGHLYRLSLRAHDRKVGGMSAWNGDQKIMAIREAAVDKGEELSGYFIAAHPILEINSSKYMPSDIHVSDIQLAHFGPVPLDEVQIPGRINNALEAYVHHFNTHNQYLQIAVDHGAVGVILFLGTHIFLLVMAIRRRKWILLGLAVVIMGSFFTEHMLLRETGLFFYAFWTAFAAYYGLGWKATPEDTPGAPDSISK